MKNSVEKSAGTLFQHNIIANKPIESSFKNFASTWLWLSYEVI